MIWRVTALRSVAVEGNLCGSPKLWPQVKEPRLVRGTSGHHEANPGRREKANYAETNPAYDSPSCAWAGCHTVDSNRRLVQTPNILVSNRRLQSGPSPWAVFLELMGTGLRSGTGAVLLRWSRLPGDEPCSTSRHRVLTRIMTPCY